MHVCDPRTIKKTEHQRIDALKLWCWRRLQKVPWTVRQSDQSVLKEINPEYSWEGLMLKLKLQYFGLLMWRADSLEKTLMLRKIEGRRGGNRGWGGWMTSSNHWTWVWANSRRWWRTGKPGMLQSMRLQRVRATEWLHNNWNVLYYNNIALEKYLSDTLKITCQGRAITLFAKLTR